MIIDIYIGFFSDYWYNINELIKTSNAPKLSHNDLKLCLGLKPFFFIQISLYNECN